MSTDSLSKFQSLLKTLFLSEYADLDFGIYRILNARRVEYASLEDVSFAL